jgi:hypothetical protein
VAQKFLVNVDLNKNEIQNAKVQNLGTAPGSPTAGQIYYDTGDNELYVYNGSAWVSLQATGDITGVTAGTGLSGGGSSGAVTVNFAPTGLSSATVASNDKVIIADVDDSDTPKTVTAASIAALAPQGDITSVVAGTNLNGGGTSGDVTLNLDASPSLTSITLSAASPLVFEGATADAHETTFAITDPTGDRTITFQNATGTVAHLDSDITGNAATATALATARNIGGVSFDGTGNIDLPGVNSAGNQNTSGTATTATTATNVTASANNSTDETVYITFVDGATGAQGIETDTGLNYNPSTGVLTTTSVTGNLTGNVTGNVSGSSGSTTGNAATATKLATARAINGTNFDGTAAITVTAAADTLTENTLASGVVSSSLTSVGTLSSLTVSGLITANGGITIQATDTLTFDGVALTTVQTSGESFADNDTSLMTSAAIDDRINSVAGVTSLAGTANEVEVSASTGAITVGLPDNVTISGNLTVNGDTTTVNTSTLSVEDPLIKLAKANSGADSVDIGFYGLYDTSGSQDLYAGLFRDANDSGKWKLFKDLQAEPTTTVNTSGTGYAAATLVVGTLEGAVTGNVTGDLTGTASTATVASTVTIADESSDTSCNVLFTTAASGNLAVKSGTNLTFNSSTGVLTATGFAGPLTGAVTGNASTATALASARNIGGVSFDGTGNIDLPGVNASGNQDTSGTAAEATILANARTIGGVSFNGSANIDLPGVNSSGNQNTSGTAALATDITVSANNSTDETVYPLFVDGATGTQGAETDTGLTYNPSSGLLTATTFSGALAASNLTGTTSITSLGTIATGTWAATDVAVDHGGTGASTAAAARDNIGATSSGLSGTTLARVAAIDCAAHSGNTSTTTVTHNFGTRDVQVQIYDASSYDEIQGDVVRTNTNVVTVTLLGAISAGDYRIVVTG